MDFPKYRPRRLRRNEKIRAMVRETSLAPRNFIYPLFVGPGKNKSQPVSSMPGVAQWSVDRAVEECEEAACSRHSRGDPIRSSANIKMRVGTEAYDDSGVVQQAIRAIKEKLPELVGHDRCLFMRIHGSRSLRRDQERRCRQRQHVGVASQRVVVPRARGRGHRRAVGHDGWPGRRDSQSARRKRLCPDRDHGLRGEIRFGFLRPVS